MPRIPVVSRQVQAIVLPRTGVPSAIQAQGDGLDILANVALNIRGQNQDAQQAAAASKFKADVSAAENVISQGRMRSVNDWIGVDPESPDLSTLKGQAFIDTSHNVIDSMNKHFDELQAGLNAEQRAIVGPALQGIAFNFQAQVAARESTELKEMEDRSMENSIQTIQAELGSYVGEAVENGFLDLVRVDQAIADIVKRRGIYAMANADFLVEDPKDYVERVSREDASRIHSMNIGLILAEGHPRALEIADNYIEEFDEDMLSTARIVANERMLTYRSGERVDTKVSQVSGGFMIVRGHNDAARDQIQAESGSAIGTPSQMKSGALAAIRGDSGLSSSEKASAIREMKSVWATEDILWRDRQIEIFTEMDEELRAGGDLQSIERRYEFMNTLDEDGRAAIREIDELTRHATSAANLESAERDANALYMKLSFMASGIDPNDDSASPDVTKSLFGQVQLVRAKHILSDAQYDELVGRQEDLHSNNLAIMSVKGEQNSIIARTMKGLGYGIALNKKVANEESSRFFYAATQEIVRKQVGVRRPLTTIETEKLMRDLSVTEFINREGRILSFDEPLLFAEAGDIDLETDVPIAWLALPQMRGLTSNAIKGAYLAWKKSNLDDQDAPLPSFIPPTTLIDDEELEAIPPIPPARSAPRSSFR